MIESFGIVIVLSCVGSSAFKVVSCASAVASLEYNIHHLHIFIFDVDVFQTKVNVLIVGLVKVLFVSVCEAVSCTTSEIAKVTVLLVALVAIFEPPEKVNVSLGKTILCVYCIYYLVQYLNLVVRLSL